MSAQLHELPLQIAAIMRDFKPWWAVAGGWAIDLYLDRVTRPHADIEIAVLRRDQAALQDYLAEWQWQKVSAGALSAWARGAWLTLPVFELYCDNAAADPQQLEVLLNEADGGEWVYRRDERIKLPLARCRLTSSAGVAFLCPEIVLLYKSKQPRAKDEQDFAAVVAHLDATRRTWLRHAIAAANPAHHWLHRLSA